MQARRDGPPAQTAYAYTAVRTYLDGRGSHIISRFNHTPVVDSLIPARSNGSVVLSDQKQLTVAAAAVLVFVGVCIVIAILLFLVRYVLRRAAIKRRRQASWILRSGQWNMEPKRTDTHNTRTGCSDASSAFSAYPYPLSEHFGNEHTAGRTDDR